MAYKHYIVSVKKRDSARRIRSEYIGRKNKAQLVAYLGLNRPEVESYSIRATQWGYRPKNRNQNQNQNLKTTKI